AGALGLALRKAPRGLAASAAVLAVATADLAVANARQVVSVPQWFFEGTPDALKVIEGVEAADPTPGPFRVHRPPFWEPPAWARTRSVDRPSEFVAWERPTLLPKCGVRLGVAYRCPPGGAEVADYKAFFEPHLVQVDAIPDGRGGVVHPRRAFDLWNTRYFILPYHPGDWASRNRSFAAFLDRT